RHGRDRRGADAGEQAGPWAESADGLGDKDDDQRTEQIEEGGRARYQRRRPALRTMQLGEIDALAVESKSPAECCDQETHRDDTPAVIADGGFVDGDGSGCFHL